MSDGEVDLDALIKSDRKRKHIEKQKRRQTKDHHHKRERESYRNNQRWRDTRRDDRHIDQRYRKGEDRRDREFRQQKTHNKQLIMQSYAISAQGFVSDVSLDDILKLAKGKKIINIKATLQRGDRQVLQPGKDTNMNVLINFVSKEQADEFIKEYSDKKLDGKNALQFQFRRGLMMKKKVNNNSSNHNNDNDKDENKNESQNNTNKNAKSQQQD